MNSYSNILIYCINLQHRKDRKKHSENEFYKIGISPDNVIYPNFVKHAKGGVYGCYDSHMKIWHDFYFNHPEQQYCIIFEDDFVSHPQSKELLQKAQQFIIRNNDAVDLMFLHNMCIPSTIADTQHNINDTDFVNGYGVLMQAYLINRKYITRILKNNNNKLPPPSSDDPIDIVTTFIPEHLLYSEKVYYTKQLCFTQLEDYSDINEMNKSFRKYTDKVIASSISICVYLKKKGLITDSNIKRVCNFFRL